MKKVVYAISLIIVISLLCVIYDQQKHIKVERCVLNESEIGGEVVVYDLYHVGFYESFVTKVETKNSLTSDKETLDIYDNAMATYTNYMYANFPLYVYEKTQNESSITYTGIIDLKLIDPVDLSEVDDKFKDTVSYKKISYPLLRNSLMKNGYTCTHLK